MNKVPAAGPGVRTALIMDNDGGIDDASAILLLKHLGIEPDYFIATGGNASMDDVIRNNFILKNYLHFSSKVVQGKIIPLSEEHDTFHGPDGLAGIAGKMMRENGVTEEILNSAMTLDALADELRGYDRIVYICTGPVTTLGYLCGCEEIRSRIAEAYVMGGGINEFNCSHDTEFNFSKDPEALAVFLKSGIDTVLFPLDLTNTQLLSEAQIDGLEAIGNMPDYITMLRYNRRANIEYNGMDGAILHDAMPVLYYHDSDDFVCEEARIISDEYGHIEKSSGGYRIRIAVSVREDLLLNEMTAAFTEDTAGR